MVSKIKNRFGIRGALLVILSLILTLAFTPLSISQVDQPVDDEREIAYKCPNPQFVGIACIEGTIDCRPRDCPI